MYSLNVLYIQTDFILDKRFPWKNGMFLTLLQGKNTEIFSYF